MPYADLFDLGDRVALITGSTKGIGRAITEAMAHFGAKVVISSRKPEACQEVAKAIGASGGEALAIRAMCPTRTSSGSSSTRRCTIWGASTFSSAMRL